MQIISKLSNMRLYDRDRRSIAIVNARIFLILSFSVWNFVNFINYSILIGIPLVKTEIEMYL